MEKISFFPLGNADTCLIELANGKNLVFDYANVKDDSDKKDLRIDLDDWLKKRFNEEGVTELDIVAFTHLDDDHIHGASEFFYFEHAKKYQDDNRLKIKTLWVPAAAIIETCLENDDARIIREEARYRLKKGFGIRVFSHPKALEEWFQSEHIDIEDRRHFISDAGTIVPELNLQHDNLEIFIHSPFSMTGDNGNLVQRNECSLVLQLKFRVSGQDTYILLAADTTHDILDEIVDITIRNQNDERLYWDIYKIPHHCSYKALSEVKGEHKTIPTKKIEFLLSKGRTGAAVVSCSKPIEYQDQDLPPHFQAAKTYIDISKGIEGEFVVTMEHPSKASPDVLEFVIDQLGMTRKKNQNRGPEVILDHKPPRAGTDYGVS